MTMNRIEANFLSFLQALSKFRESIENIYITNIPFLYSILEQHQIRRLPNFRRWR